MRRIFIFYVVTTILLSACNSQSATPTNAVISDTPIPLSSSTSTPTQTLAPAPTYTSTITLTPAGGGSGKIVFVSEKDGNPEIYSINSDGSQKRRLTDNLYSDNSPQWSPDGKRIVYISERTDSRTYALPEIYVMDADGSNQTRITNLGIIFGSPVSPQWSPDEEKILFALYGSGSQQGVVSEIYTVNIDGTELTRLTSHRLEVTDPKWSPDGSKIVYSLHAYGVGEIYVINADGTGDTRLTFNNGYNLYPEWSPNGKVIAYISHLFGVGYNLNTVGVNGTDEKQITNDNHAKSRPEWSPDGTTLVYDYFDGESNHICFLDIDSRAPNCSVKTISGSSPKWSPDGKKIAFISNLDGERNIYLMNTDGSEIIRLTNNNNGNSLWQFQWSP